MEQQATLSRQVNFVFGNRENIAYQSGFGNEFSTEALAGALPHGQNNPRVCPYGLYAEQISGTAFTVPRGRNQRTWFYRTRPSVTHNPFHPLDFPVETIVSDFRDAAVTPNQLRWRPFPTPSGPVDFVRGLFTIAGSGSAGSKEGYAIHVYAAKDSMDDSCMCNADGDFLIVPQLGALNIITECGLISIAPGEIAVVQRGHRFSVGLPDGPSRGYVLEIFDGHFQLPDLGPIGANGLANPRDFQTPVAWFEDRDCSFTVVQKLMGRLFSVTLEFSPFNVVAWHGNYAPFKYDLSKFCPVNSVSFDHPDPSIFTVLTAPGKSPGVALADFVVFPPRWAVARNTFRPPYFHRNVMSEFMGLITGEYDGKKEGFEPGGASLHICMTPHGPDTGVYEAAIAEDTDLPKFQDSTLAFMFEVDAVPRVTAAALASPLLDREYYRGWQGLKKHFNPEAKTVSP
uniref:homogentisate 1,2-dioxygenase n=1 Tax=Tetraselmis sp. GSL018 TaxID=582737 RepID=A0A061RTT2_9CHLO|eukprot:CAMPEP_0177620912 /NCGR_PEP_ID=MMETSP0419_2-20121207/27237_1 /TAXON_ID=582737 /ORGANISM="Tetraselmis sp., Strain GSL018" /LENGTH=455 /DNA_ID=CAMNT_0019120659 /DNA_START=217 /DNA_END=1584 /DNA_ORIENTATION=-